MLLPQLFHLIYSNEDYVKQLAQQPGWQDVLTKLYVKESYESRAASLADSSTQNSLDNTYRAPLRRDQALLIEDPRTDIFLNYSSRDEEDEEEDEGGQRDISEGFSDISQSPPCGGEGLLKNSLHFKPYDSVDQGSRSSSLSNTADLASPRPDEEGLYHPLSPFATSPFDLELGGMGEAGTGTGTHTPAGSQADTPSPLDHSKPFPPLRPRKSSSLSNVLDDTSYGTDPPTGDTISNTSNPQVRLLPCTMHSFS